MIEKTGDEPAREDLRRFAASFQAFLDWMQRLRPDEDDEDEVVALVADFLGPEAARESVIRKELSPFEHVNLQTAVDAWAADEQRTVVVQGLAIPPHHGGVSLEQLAAGVSMPWVRLAAPAFVDLPNGPDSTLACLPAA